MSIHLHFHPEIPPGWCVWKKNLEVTGVPFRISDAKKFAYGRGQTLSLEMDSENSRDPNAIKVMGNYIRWFLHHNAHIGFVPAEEAQKIVKRNVTEFMARLRNIWIGDQTSLSIIIRFDVLRQKKSHSRQVFEIVAQHDLGVTNTTGS